MPKMSKSEWIVVEHGEEKKLNSAIKNLQGENFSLYWNRITIIDGAQYEKDDVLKGILNAIFPHKIIPVKYQKDKNDSFFIFRNSISALSNFMKSGLKFHNQKTDTLVYLRVIIKYSLIKENDINPVVLIDKCVSERIETKKKVVDLRNFHNEPALKLIYAPLSIPQNAATICEYICSRLKPHVILLSHNELDRLDILEQFRRLSHNLVTLDLSHNNITWSGFEKIPFINIKELWLEGNPLYADFSSSAELIKEVKRVMPSILKLDDVELGKTVPGDIVNLKTYFVDGSYDTFVDHFLHHYFSLFETNRELLRRIYHPEASFSISVNHVEPNVTTGTQRIHSYMKYSRNLLSMSDFKKSYELLKYGTNEIVEFLKTFPKVMFDPYSFQVDVPVTHIGKTDLVTINACGIFKDLDCLENSAFFAFDRTFILTPWKVDRNEWKIINDIWAITNAPPSAAKSSFKFAKAPIQSDFAIMIDPKMKNKEQLAKIFGNLTELNSAWVQKFLSESSWNFESALQAFTDQYKLDQLPPEAFLVKED